MQNKCYKKDEITSSCKSRSNDIQGELWKKLSRWLWAGKQRNGNEKELYRGQEIMNHTKRTWIGPIWPENKST